jgi:23S rRNA pseudouridine2605 synthase
VKLDDGLTAPAKIEIIRVLEKNVWFTITIHEGRFRQVRRMCEAVELPLVKLKRIRYGTVLLGDLKTGEYRLLDPAEANALSGTDRNQRREPAAKAAPFRKRLTKR